MINREFVFTTIKQDNVEPVEIISQQGLECKLCKDVIFSNSRHDFRGCKCKHNFVDGGLECPRFGGNPSDYLLVNRLVYKYKLADLKKV